jgi:hypothetical protein
LRSAEPVGVAKSAELVVDPVAVEICKTYSGLNKVSFTWILQMMM